MHHETREKGFKLVEHDVIELQTSAWCSAPHPSGASSWREVPPRMNDFKQ
jgi:hypothetical protein